MSIQNPVPRETLRPPGPRPAYPGQHLLAMLRDPLALLEEAAQHGDVARLSLGRQGAYLINDPQAIREVLVSNHRAFIKSPFLQRLRSFLGDGLLTSEGALHLRQRRLIQPAFHRQRIQEYGRQMVAFSQQTGARWQDGETRDMHHEMMRLTMVIVGQALFGVDIESEAGEIGQAITVLLASSQRMLLPFGQYIQRLPLPGNREINQAGALLDSTIRAMIAERRKAAQAGAEESHDLLGMLLSARDEDAEGQGSGQGMSDQQVRDEVLTLFLAGHETTANALTWTFYLLSQHPEVEARLHAELAAVLGGRAPGPEDVERLPYTRRVLSESMRLYPPAWIVGREAIEDVELGGCHIPAGSTVLMSQWLMHRDARFFPDPQRFDPERWTPAAQEARPRFSYFPFGGGPRLCVGEPFAWMEGILILATLCQRWRLRLAPGQEVAVLPQITLRPRYGMQMRLEARG